MTKEIITPELEHPEKEFEEAADEEERVVDERFAREQEEISKAVLELAHEFEQLGVEQLTHDLAQELTTLARTPVSNSMEIITHPPPQGSRYDVLRTQLTAEAGTLKAPSLKRAKAELLTTLLGHDLTEGLTELEAKSSTNTLLTHLVYAAKGQPLPELAASPAAKAVIDVGAKLATMSDSTFWKLLANAHDGTVADPDELCDQLAIMGIAHELQPLKTQFTWWTGDAVALQVDELVAAATIDPDYVDLSKLYRRAGTLKFNNDQPIPRAITTELVRMAVADLITQGKWKPTAARTPNATTIGLLLALEPVSTDPKAVDRNAVRTSAKALIDNSKSFGKTLDIARQTQTRASRGHLSEAVDFLLTRLKHGASAMPGGTKAATTLDAFVQKSKLLPALEAWSATYRAGEVRSGKLKTLLDDVNQRAQALADRLNAAFPNPREGTPQAAAAAFIEAVQVPLAEVALEAAELLRTPPVYSSDPLSGPATTAEQNTVRASARRAALDAINGRAGGLPKFFNTTVPKELQSEPWATSLRNAATNWSTAETRDANQVVKAASAFVEHKRCWPRTN